MNNVLRVFGRKLSFLVQCFRGVKEINNKKPSVLVIIILMFVSMIDSFCEYYPAGCSSRRIYLIYTASLFPSQRMFDITKPTILDTLGRVNLSPRQ